MVNISKHLAVLLCIFYTTVGYSVSNESNISAAGASVSIINKNKHCSTIKVQSADKSVAGQGIVFRSNKQLYILTPAHVWRSQVSPELVCKDKVSATRLLGISVSLDLAVLEISDAAFRNRLQPVLDLNESTKILIRQKNKLFNQDERLKDFHVQSTHDSQITYYNPNGELVQSRAPLYFFKSNYFWPYKYWAHYNNGILDGVSGALVEIPFGKSKWEAIGMIIRYNSQTSQSAAISFIEMIPHLKHLLKGNDPYKEKFPRSSFVENLWFDDQSVLMRKWTLSEDFEVTETCFKPDRNPFSYAVVAGGSDWGDGGGRTSAYSAREWDKLFLYPRKKYWLIDSTGDVTVQPVLFLAPFEKACFKVNLLDKMGRIFHSFKKAEDGEIIRPTEALYSHLQGRLSLEDLTKGLSTDEKFNRLDIFKNICESGREKKLQLVGQTLLAPMNRSYVASNRDDIRGDYISFKCSKDKRKVEITISIPSLVHKAVISIEESILWHERVPGDLRDTLVHFLPNSASTLRIMLDNKTLDAESISIGIPRGILK